MFLTSVVTGSKIRTMWMTPFYLFFGTLFVYLFQAQINIKKLKPFMIGFIFFFFLSPAFMLMSQYQKKTKELIILEKKLQLKLNMRGISNLIPR